MARLYSDLLFELVDVASGDTFIGGPPDGYLWVLRDIHSECSGAWYQGLYGWVLTLDDSFPLIRKSPPETRALAPVDWQGRIVIPTGNTLTWTTIDDGWSITASGYQLSTP